MAYRRCIIGLTLLLLGAAPAQKASMSTIKLGRLGNVSPFEHKGGWRKSEVLEPTPIILWRGQTKRAGDRLRIVAPLVRPDPKVVVTGFFLLSLS